MIRLFFLLALVVAAGGNSFSQVKRTRDAFLMGGRFDITIVAKDSLTAEQYIDTVIAEISRIEYLISDWKPETQVSRVNENAGIQPVKVDKEVLELTERALKISEITNGAFDISFAAMEKIWKFDGTMTTMPSPEAVKKARQKVGYKNIIINKDSSTIFLRLPGMKIGFGALGEGYAADKCRAMMLARGITAGLINATGDIQAWGKQPNGRPWRIGINDPFKSNDLVGAIAINGAITTSGSYEKYALIDGKRYTHIINPATGYPATGLTSVTITGPDTEMANAFSTSIMVLGPGAGLKLLKQFPEYKAFMITDAGKYIISPGFKMEKIRR
ncbi:FAD:protein FMN transferase [Niabella sp. 22666]|uniref:FAD:protein FMN transferase n=1 Tax=Niabella sp. 22666 TaxID=3453954 RepID=UPI003F849EAA